MEYKSITLRTKFRDTYNGLRCTTYINGNADRSTGCSGGGYDMRGTALANVLKEYTPLLERAKKLQGNHGTGDEGGYYGLTFYKEGKYLKSYEKGATIHIDGACGHSTIERIAEACNISIAHINDTKMGDEYIISWEE